MYAEKNNIYLKNFYQMNEGSAPGYKEERKNRIKLQNKSCGTWSFCIDSDVVIPYNSLVETIRYCEKNNLSACAIDTKNSNIENLRRYERVGHVLISFLCIKTNLLKSTDFNMNKNFKCDCMQVNITVKKSNNLLKYVDFVSTYEVKEKYGGYQKTTRNVIDVNFNDQEFNTILNFCQNNNIPTQSMVPTTDGNWKMKFVKNTGLKTITTQQAVDILTS